MPHSLANRNLAWPIVGEIFGVKPETSKAAADYLDAADYPSVAFSMGFSFPPDDRIPNLAVFDSHMQDASYLSRIIAGSMAKGSVGMTGGLPIPKRIA